MKILMIHPHDIYSTEEPWTVRIRELAREFVKAGHKVKLIYFPLPKGLRGKVEPKMKDVETIAFSRRKWSLPGNCFRILKYAKWADVIHFQKCFANAALPAIFGSFVHNRWLHYDWDDNEYAIYNFDPPSQLYGKYLLYMEKKMPSVADSVSYSSEFLRKLALKRGADPKYMAEAHVGANLLKFNPSVNAKEIKEIYGKKIVVYMGQLHGGQYVELFLKSVQYVKVKRKDVVFLIVGGGHNLEPLKQKARELGLGNDIIFTGFVQQDEVVKFLAAADVCVASFEDNTLTRAKSPLKIVEYLSMGKAIVASDVGEVRRMLGESGYKAKPGDAEDLANGIIMFLSDDYKRKMSEKLARLRALEEYNWKVTAEHLLKLYEKGML